MEPNSENPSAWYKSDVSIGEVLITEQDIKNKVSELGKRITQDYHGRSLLIVGVLKGALLFVADLVRSIDLPAEYDFMAVSSYGVTTKTSGVVRIVKDLDVDLTGKDVLIVEDIVDSGLSLSYLARNLRARNARSVKVCALLVKEGLQPTNMEISYVGFVIPPVFVIGYGLDLAERYRNIPFVALYNG